MKKGFKILLSICALIVILVIAVVLIDPLGLRNEVVEIEVGSIDLTTVQNGLYTGEYTAGPVSVSLTVAVENNKITDIHLYNHDNGLGEKAEKIIDNIISEQSLDVDCISGATISSNVIRKAIEIAVNTNTD